MPMNKGDWKFPFYESFVDKVLNSNFKCAYYKLYLLGNALNMKLFYCVISIEINYKQSL
jgi:hypothetical protein